MVNITQKTFQSADASTSQNGAAFDTRTCLTFSTHAIVTGNPSGTLKLQASNDPATQNLLPGSPSNWCDIPQTSINIAGAGSYLIFQPNICFSFIRVVYTFTTGTGTITARSKALGY